MAKKYVPIELDKTRNLRYGMVALMKIEEKINKPISKINFEEVTTKDMAVIIWAGLVHEDKTLTPDKVAELIDEYSDLNSAAQIMGKALQEAFGSPNAVGAVENGAGK